MLERLRHITRGLRLGEDERGALQVELAFTILTVLVVIFMTIELCSAIYTYVVLSDAANEGVRYAIVHSSDTTGVTTKVTTYASYSLHNMDGMTVSVTYPSTGDPLCVTAQTPPCKVAVHITYPYVPYLNFMSSPPTMHAYAEGRLVY